MQIEESLIGYAEATEVAMEALATGRGVDDLVPEKKMLPHGQLYAIVESEMLTNLNPRS